jgi:hypothetical protein
VKRITVSKILIAVLKGKLFFAQNPVVFRIEICSYLELCDIREIHDSLGRASLHILKQGLATTYCISKEYY